MASLSVALLLLFVYIVNGYSIGNENHILRNLDKSKNTSKFTSNHIYNNERKFIRRNLKQSHVPQFMYDLYEHLSNKRWSPKFDTARSYSMLSSDLYNAKDSKLSRKLSTQSQVTEVRTVIFNISHFPSNEEIQLAQLRLFIKPQRNAYLDEIYDLTLLSLYTFFADGFKVKLHSTRILDVYGNYWETFDVTGEIIQWLKNKQTKEQKFEIHIEKPHSNKLSQNSLLDDIIENDEIPQILILSSTEDHRRRYNEKLIRSKRNIFNDTERLLQQNKASNIVQELKIMGLIKTEISHSIVKRSEEEYNEEIEEQTNYIEEFPRVRKGKSKKRKNRMEDSGRKSCKRKPMNVDFAEINYDQWIIAPKSYEAFECAGKCTFPMGAHLTPTKHAVIQALINSMQPKQAGRICCVPTKLDPISVLYLDEDGTVVCKYQYEDMVVAECGCR